MNLREEHLTKTKRVVAFIFSGFIILGLCTTTTKAQGGSSVQALGVGLRCVFSEGAFTEGPAVSMDGRVFFSDLTWEAPDRMESGHLWCYDPTSGRSIVYRSPSNMSNGIAFDGRGRMVVAEGETGGARRISRTDLRSGKSEILASGYGGRPFNSPNDLVVDRKGRILFTDPRYGSSVGVEQPTNGVYRLDPDGSLALLIDDIPMPNGIALSPDEKILYVGCFQEGEGGQMVISSYTFQPDGSARFQKSLIDFSGDAGPDGMAVDVEGNLYVAIRDESNPRIGVFSPDGFPLGDILVPEVPSNITFGRGPQGKTIYITAGRSLYQTEVQKEGFHAETGH